MCYHLKSSLKAQLKKAKTSNDKDLENRIKEKLKEFSDYQFHQVSGFDHPKILVYKNKEELPSLAHWGLIPSWTKTQDQKNKLWNSTLNARRESIFEKPSFKDSAIQKRCLVYVDGFYEHHHSNGTKYPFFIQNEEPEALCFAGLWSEWIDTATGEIIPSFSIVTKKGEGLMSKIHNNPNLSEPRMPVIFSEEQSMIWSSDQMNEKELQDLIEESNQISLKAHTVASLKGKGTKGNTKEATEGLFYRELGFKNGLFQGPAELQLGLF